MRRLNVLLTVSAAAVAVSSAAFAQTSTTLSMVVKNQTSQSDIITDSQNAFGANHTEPAGGSGTAQFSQTGSYPSISDQITATAPISGGAYCTFNTSNSYSYYYHHYQYTSSATPTTVNGVTPTCAISLNESGQLTNGSYLATMTISGY